MVHRVYLSPGMFGFGQLVSYDYFTHVRQALETRFAARGLFCTCHVADVPPTASIRRRAHRLYDLIAHTAQPEDIIHLFGHSTGGLDARLVTSPSAVLPGTIGDPAWLQQVRSVTTLNTPHFGTPLASFFATVSGQRMLYLLSAMTYVALTVGSQPMALASGIVVALSHVDRMVGLELKLLDDAADRILRVLEPGQSREVHSYLSAIRDDQGAVIQLTPEAMDLFQAGVEDRDGVRYQCVVTLAPSQTLVRFARANFNPFNLVSGSIFTAIHKLTARSDTRYPCEPYALTDAQTRALRGALGTLPSRNDNDGVVPTLSHVWGDPVWIGHADHLDVLGHFYDEAPASGTTKHADWMRSGSNFGREQFNAMMDAVVQGMLR